MDIKLNAITKQYRKFQDEQVLTDSQLNEFIDYFDDQDRLSRTQLIGTGIVCGLRATWEEVTETNTRKVIVSQGVGVTTDGDLLSLQEPILDVFEEPTKEVQIINEAQEYTHYKPFENEVNYTVFSAAEPYLTELAYFPEGSPVKEGFIPIPSSLILESKVAILYLESFSRIGDVCQGANCDTQGIPQIANLKVLLIDSNKVNLLLASDTLYNKYDNYQTLNADLPSLTVRRALFKEDEIVIPSDLQTVYTQAISATPSIVQELGNAFQKIATTFDIQLGLNTGITLIDTIITAVTTNGGDYQYRYSLLKDLVATYNEIKGLLLNIQDQCIPDINSFPKHLLLGQLRETADSDFVAAEATYEFSRHAFYKATPLLFQNETYKEIQSLGNRFVFLLNNYSYGSNSTIKLTPSNRNVRLGNKAIPYYYNITDSFLSYWNFKDTLSGNKKEQLSYHTNALSQEITIQEPFSFNIDSNDFYRVEGHIAQDYVTVFNKIKDLRATYGLAFDIKILRLTGEDDLTPEEDQLPTELLSEFMERNTGFVHRGGVEEGGTLILLIEEERNSSNTQVNTSQRVFADFSLPYACCSREEQVLASIATDALCANDTPIPIDVVPFGGKLQAWINGVELPEVLFQTGTENLFDPTKVLTVNLEQTIRFTINEKPVVNTLIVHALPQVTVSVESVTYNDTGVDATVTFKVTGSQIDQYDYQWDFDDREKSTEKPVNGLLVHTYDLEENEEEEFEPTVLVTNANSCGVTIDIPLVPLKLVINKDTKIKIYFDNSGSMSSTKNPLIDMRDTTLKRRLLPLYGDDGDLYDQNVTVESETWKNERTFLKLNEAGITADGVNTKGNVIALVFQDETGGQGYRTSSSFDDNRSIYQSDMKAFRDNLTTNFGTGNRNYFRGVIFQVDGFPVFKEFLQAVEAGTSPYNEANGLDGIDDVSFSYDLEDGSNVADYYLNKIVEALEALGYTL